MHEYLKDNIWIAHFQNVYKKHLKEKENWIDFESEISGVIQNVDELYHAYMEADREFYEAKIQHCKEKLPGRIEYYNPDIDAIHPDAIFSFNYSDTWKRVYEYNRGNVKYSFIHGKAQSIPYIFNMDICIDKNQMVLGIDEYLPTDRRNKEVEFIAFKKYYQRIYKKTENEYKSWLAEIDKQRKEGRNQENKLYIFGHSLDVTDGDILNLIGK